MRRSELIEALAGRFPQLVAKDAEMAVKEIIEAIGRCLSGGDRVEIRGFGSFTLRYRPPRTGRNPKTGKTVEVPGKNVPYFKPGKAMRERLEASLELEQPEPLKKAA